MGKALVVCTHLLDSIENTCNRVLVMRDGKIITNSEMSKLKELRGINSTLEDIFFEVTEDEGI